MGVTMPATPRRETMIALKARQQAYRIASDILNPELEVPPPPQPAIPIELDPSHQPVIRPSQAGVAFLAAFIWLLVLITILGSLYFQWKTP
jgi:hypothetical protein